MTVEQLLQRPSSNDGEGSARLIPMVGVHEGLANETYHRGPGLSASMLKVLLANSPAHAWEQIKNPKPSTPAMEFGTAVHAAVLEPETFFQRFVEAPKIDRRTKEGKALWEMFQKENEGKTVVAKEDFDRIARIIDQVAKHPVASELLTGGKAEASYYWEDEETGVLCKARPDYVRDDGIIVDVKTTEDASFFAFQRTVAVQKYHVQSQFHLTGVSKVLGKKLSQFVHLVIESKAPHEIALYVLDDGSLDRAEADIRKGIQVWEECTRTGIWPGYAKEIQNLSLPHWAFGE